MRLILFYSHEDVTLHLFWRLTMHAASSSVVLTACFSTCMYTFLVNLNTESFFANTTPPSKEADHQCNP